MTGALVRTETAQANRPGKGCLKQACLSGTRNSRRCNNFIVVRTDTHVAKNNIKYKTLFFVVDMYEYVYIHCSITQLLLKSYY